MSILRFNTKVHFEFGARRELAGELAGLGIARPLFVTDKGIVAAGVLDQALEGWDGSRTVFDATPPNPTEAASLAGAALYREAGCDGVVGIGGGASLDLAKAVAILVTNPFPLWDFCNRHARPRPIVDPARLVLVPTTSGSGSEVGRSAVMIFDNGVKAGVGCPNIVCAAICDPELTLGLPPSLTAATGTDALSHCVETFCSPTVNPPADAIALDGLGRIAASIERACADGQDRDARWNMMMGSVEGAVAFQKGMGAVHALSHPLGAYGFHHGTLNAILLPHVVAYNLDQIGPAKCAAMRAAMGLSADADLPAAFDDLNGRIGVPRTLSAIGADAATFDAVAEAALSDNAHKTNPRPVTAADYRRLLDAAF
jgi:4-hydroxybutyrate dehydrogenase